MSEKTQLTRINVPAITDARYIEGMSDAFDKINDNFKKIASLPFLQGVQGDSYQLEEYKIWDDWLITEDGKVLLDSIFGKDVTVKGNSFDKIRECIGEDLAGTSPIDFFKNGNDIVNNSLYFYVIKDDTGNVIEKQLGQYYYFIDGRLKDIGNVYNDGVSLNGFNDYTGFYQYKYDSENNSKYVKVEILPTIYYDQNKNDICWKFNGNETGISAIGVKGADGKDADLLIVRVTANENDCTGLVNAIINPIGGNTAEDQWIENPKDFKVGKALICIQRDNTAQDFAYGQVIKSGADYNAYWEPNYNFSKLIGNNRITNYFYNMGEDDTETSPFYLAIPSSYNRGASGTAENKMKAHVIKGSSETSEDLNIFYSEDAFGENGEQNRNVGSTTSTKKLNIQNYNTTISKKLTVSGSAEVSGGLTVKNGGAVISSGGIQVTTQKPKASPGTNSDADVKSNVLIGHNNPGLGKYNYFTEDITKCGYPLVTMSYDGDGVASKDCMVFGNADICALKWNGTKYEKGELCLQDILGYYGKTKVGGSFEVVRGTASFGGTVSMKSNLGVTGNLTVSGQSTFNKPVTLGSSASLTVDGAASFNKGATFNDTSSFNKPVTLGSSASLTVDGAASFNNTSSFNKPVTLGSSASLTVGGTSTFSGIATFGGTATFNNPVTMNSSLGVSGIANFSSPVTISSTLKVTNTATFDGTANFNSITNLNGLVRVLNDQDSSSKGTGALVVSGGAGIAKNLYVGSSTNISGKITGGSGIKIYGGASEFYSGNGTTTDPNYLKVDSSSVTVGGSIGKLNVDGNASIGSLEVTDGVTVTGDTNFNVHLNTGTVSLKSSDYGIGFDDLGSMEIKTNDLTIEGDVSMSNSLSVTGGVSMSNSLSVTGGVGISGAVNIGGITKVTNTTDTSDATSGALVVTGGVGIGGKLNVGSTNGSTSTTTGALVVKGGAGIQKQVHLGQYLSINNTYDSAKETSGKISDITDDVHPGQIYLGEPPSNKTTPINRMIINRHAIQAYTTYGTTTNNKGETIVVYKDPTASSFRINPCGGGVIINNSTSTTTINGPLTSEGDVVNKKDLTVEGNVLNKKDLTVNGQIKGALNEGYLTWNSRNNLKVIPDGTISPIAVAWSSSSKVGSGNALALFKDEYEGKKTNSIQHWQGIPATATQSTSMGDDTLFSLFNTNEISIFIGNQTPSYNKEGKKDGYNRPVKNGEQTTITIWANDLGKAKGNSKPIMFYYGKIKKVLFYISKAKCDLKVTIRGNDPLGKSQTIVSDYPLSGDAGWNEVPLNITFGGNEGQGLKNGVVDDFNRFYKLSFSFSIDNTTSTTEARALLKGIRLLSDVQWGVNAFTTANLSNTGHIYTYDKDANTTFPAKVTASKGLTVSNGGLTVSNGGLTVSNGGLTVSKGGASITGNASVSGILTYGEMNLNACYWSPTSTSSMESVFTIVDNTRSVYSPKKRYPLIYIAGDDVTMGIAFNSTLYPAGSSVILAVQNFSKERFKIMRDDSDYMKECNTGIYIVYFGTDIYTKNSKTFRKPLYILFTSASYAS